jgi:hypothetical protein
MADKTSKLQGIPVGDDVSVLDKVRALTWASAGGRDSVTIHSQSIQANADH